MAASMIEFWALLPDGRRVSTKRPRVGRYPKFVTCFQDTDGEEVWWCHTFHETEGAAKSGLRVHLHYRARRLRKLGVEEHMIDLKDCIMPVYFLCYAKR